MRVESDLSGVLEEGPASNASEMEVMRPHLIDDAGHSFDPPHVRGMSSKPATSSRWLWVMVGVGVLMMFGGVAALVLGGAGAAAAAFLL